MPTLQELIDAGFATEQVLSQEELDALCNIMNNKPEDADQDEPIPKGWRLVPEDPTPAMIVSGVNASGPKDVVVMYKAMIAESPISNTTE